MPSLTGHQWKAVKELCEQFDIEFSGNTADHLVVLLESLKVYTERDKSYGPVWKQYGALSNLLSVARKVDRLIAVWWNSVSDDGAPALHKDALDDAVDLINYCVFFMRNARNGNITGTVPERPQLFSVPDASPQA